ncbi:hypothetical protein NRP93_003134 [Clostridium botulinum]|nr:hypothetical protein [Clostridium botulinum]
MKKIFPVIKKLLLYFWWQDIEKSHFLPRILNLFFSLFLSFCSCAWMYGANITIILKIIIGLYLILSFMSFWPVSNLLDEKNKFIGAAFFIFQNNFILFSFPILLRYIIKVENIS